ncbi:hypothetical protein ACLKA6_013765 [Drosophila palustris]
MNGIYGFLIGLWLHASLVLSNIIQYDPCILEDAQLTTIGLIRKYGYAAEEHKIETKDGFRLSVHRIPKRGAQPVLLVHGLEDSSAAWVLTGPCCGLAYLLSDRGYDVWMINTRGNRYSRKHRRYHPLMRQFWDGIYDIPATIDYMLDRSEGYKQVHYVGHSQGTSSVFVMGAEKPDYMKKIKLLQALAPVAYFDNLNAPLIQLFKPYFGTILQLAKLLGIYEFPPETDVWNRLNFQFCSFAFRDSCTYFLMLLMGMDISQFNQTLFPLFSKHFVAGSSTKSVEHYAQLVEKGGFFKFDYGNPTVNYRKYGSYNPPQYKLANINCKVALYYSVNDQLTSFKDVQRLRKKLPNVVHDELLAYKKFNHLDFTVAIDVKKLLYDSMFQVMEKVDKGEL